MKVNWIPFLAALGCCPFIALGEAGLKPNQKVFLFLKEPLREEESVVIRLNNSLEENIDLKAEEDKTGGYVNTDFEILYQKQKHGLGNEILVDLQRGGMVVLDVYDFYGKKLGNLYSGFQSPGVLVLNENEKWKVFKRFNGIVYFTLSVDGNVVKKKLVAKVD